MLVRAEDGGALVIEQLSHAWLSGQLARAWGNERFGALERREEIALGAEQHDIGWAQADSAPRLSGETGLPRGFMETTVGEHLEIWREAPDRLMSQSALAALVVSLHGGALSQLRAHGAPEQAPQLEEHIERERRRQARLAEALGLSGEQVERLQRQMWTWDGLSLALCLGWEPFTAHQVPSADGMSDLELRRRGEQAWTLEPWPFERERVEVRCEARRLAGRYADELALRRDFEAARPQRLTFELTPAA